MEKGKEKKKRRRGRRRKQTRNKKQVHEGGVGEGIMGSEREGGEGRREEKEEQK